jgi:beta-lactamase class A
MAMRPNVFYLWILLGLLVSFGAGWLGGKDYFGEACTSTQFQYINPQLGCGDTYRISKRSYVAFKGRLESTIQTKIQAGEVTEAAVYFRDLYHGPTFGINEYAKFVPASLLKLPMLLTYFRLGEEQPNLLKTSLVFRGTADPFGQDLAHKESIQENVPYTINDLLAYMIKYSDNRAYYVLRDYLHQVSPDEDLLQRTFIDLGIIDPQHWSEDTITVRSYAAMFTQLYHASYLQRRETSEKALALLAEAAFNEGIKAGVPAGTPVAHKFGVRSGFEGNLKQLHDCGIVYYPDNPYLICIMTRGYDEDALSDIISEISKMTYEEFDSRKL